MTLAFEKYEGLGNDFVVVEQTSATPRVTAAQAIALCDRHRGIGADGVLLCGRDAQGLFMRVINADGTVPEMCGNGLRCAAWFLRTRGLAEESSFTVQTDAGPHRVWLEDGGSEQGSSEQGGSVRVEMNAPSFAPETVGLLSDVPWVDAPWELGESTLHLTAVSMGNPHVVTFDADMNQRHVLAPAIQQDATLRAGANVGFCEPDGASNFVLHVFERGAGWTQACGTGACAAVAAAVATGRAQSGSEVQVQLPGGSLYITDRGVGERMWMRGAARHVFSGTI